MGDKELYGRIHELFEYKEGKLFWKVSTSNRVRVGDRAGNVAAHGYRRVGFDGGLYWEHRIVFVMHHGWLPKYVDHIDGNGENNEITNLRACTNAQNTSNRGRQENNRSGYKGVSWCRRNQKWIAQIQANGKRKHLGSFSDPAVAHGAYQKAARQMHKEFANYGD